MKTTYTALKVPLSLLHLWWGKRKKGKGEEGKTGEDRGRQEGREGERREGTRTERKGRDQGINKFYLKRIT